MKVEFTGVLCKEEQVPKVSFQLQPIQADKPKTGVATATTSLGAMLQQTMEFSSSPHLVVRARAGTGKTTTLVQGLRHIKDDWVCSACNGEGSHYTLPPETCQWCRGSGQIRKLSPSVQQQEIWNSLLAGDRPLSIGFTSFGRGITDELKNRVPRGVDAMTMHSMGLRALRQRFREIEVIDNRSEEILAWIKGYPNAKVLLSRQFELTRVIATMVKLAKQNLFEESWGLETFESMAAHYDVDLEDHDVDQVFQYSMAVLEHSKDVDRDGRIDHNDMVWLPVVLDIHMPKYDMLLVDEAQDLNRCQQELALKAGRRLVLVGDEKQAIYGFAGADSEALARMITILSGTDQGCEVLPLTMTRRCGHAIVEEARRLVPDFEAAPDNPPGKISYSTLGGGGEYSSVTSGDMVLCRVNGPLVSECLRFIREGKKATIQGRDIGSGLASTVKAMKASGLGQLAQRLHEWVAKAMAKEAAKANPSTQRMINLRDRYECLLTFIDVSESVKDVIQRILDMFSDDKGTGILLATIHRAKGLEAKRVFILRTKGASIPHPMARTEVQIEQEYNLLYVAQTRAIEELIYVQ